jgi:hypothetical protein
MPPRCSPVAASQTWTADEFTRFPPLYPSVVSDAVTSNRPSRLNSASRIAPSTQSAPTTRSGRPEGSNTRTVPSSEAVAVDPPSGANVRAVSRAPCPPAFRKRGGGGSARQSRAVESPAVNTRRPSGLSEASWTGPLCPRKTASSSPVVASHSRAVPSWEVVRSRLPFGSNSTDVTLPECPRRRRTSFPVSASQTRTVASAPAVATFPPGPKETALTAPLCPVSTTFSLSPVAVSQTAATAAVKETATFAPSRLKATEVGTNRVPNTPPGLTFLRAARSPPVSASQTQAHRGSALVM